MADLEVSMRSNLDPGRLYGLCVGVCTCYVLVEGSAQYASIEKEGILAVVNDIEIVTRQRIDKRF